MTWQRIRAGDQSDQAKRSFLNWRYNQDLAPADGMSFFSPRFYLPWFYPSRDDTQTLAMNPIPGLALPNLPPLATRDIAAALLTLAGMGVARTHIDSTLGYPPEQSRFVRELCRTFGR